MRIAKIASLALLSGSLFVACSHSISTKPTTQPGVFDSIKEGQTVDEINAEVGAQPDSHPLPNVYIWSKNKWVAKVVFDDSGKATSDIQKTFVALAQ